MNEEQIKKMIADDFDNFINESLDSVIIFKYISNLEKENLKLKEQYCERTDCSGRLGNSKKVEELEQEKKQLKEQLQQKEDIINKIREYLTSYESISEIEGLNNVKENKKLDEKTMNEMIRRYMNVHDKTLEILDNKGDENNG